MRILLIGQCTLHWGRLEFGNMGNHAIIEPFVRELHRVFPGAEIRTTFQMSDEFCERERITRLPADLYYAWGRNNLWVAAYETLAAWIRKYLGLQLFSTPYMEEVLKADIVIDFSGDMWGDNALLVGRDRFLVGVLKDLTAHWLGVPKALLAGSPGPFGTSVARALARFTLKRFDLVTNREPRSTDLLQRLGIPMDNVWTTACPSFLFEAREDERTSEVIAAQRSKHPERPVVGFVICGWNMPVGPYSRWPRDDKEYLAFAVVVEYLVNSLGCNVCLFSHNNGFAPPPNFRVMHGRDYQIAQQLLKVLRSRGVRDNIFILEEVLDAAQTKAVIGQFDMLVSGRLHAAIAGLSQLVPTTIIDYGHEPRAHKLRGLAELLGISEFVADPSDVSDMIEKVRRCWDNREALRQHLSRVIPEARELARKNFDLLRELVSSGGAE